jgi:hypothetical protein
VARLGDHKRIKADRAQKLPPKINRAKLRRKLVKDADTAMSLFVRARDKQCVLCGKREGLTAGHLITRSKHSVRWDLRNVFCQCQGCNYRHEFDSHLFTLWWIRQFGAKAYERLVEDSNSIYKHSIEELTDLVNTFTELEKIQ